MVALGLGAACGCWAALDLPPVVPQPATAMTAPRIQASSTRIRITHLAEFQRRRSAAPATEAFGPISPANWPMPGRRDQICARRIGNGLVTTYRELKAEALALQRLGLLLAGPWCLLPAGRAGAPRRRGGPMTGPRRAAGLGDTRVMIAAQCSGHEQHGDACPRRCPASRPDWRHRPGADRRPDGNSGRRRGQGPAIRAAPSQGRGRHQCRSARERRDGRATPSSTAGQLVLTPGGRAVRSGCARWPARGGSSTSTRFSAGSDGEAARGKLPIPARAGQRTFVDPRATP